MSKKFRIAFICVVLLLLSFAKIELPKLGLLAGHKTAPIVTSIKAPTTKSKTDSTSSTPTSSASSDIMKTWGRVDTVQDHFDRHGADFKATSLIDYVTKAHQLYLDRSSFLIKRDAQNIRVYDSKTNSFGAYNIDGTTKSFFKPSGGKKYFDGQLGTLTKN